MRATCSWKDIFTRCTTRFDPGTLCKYVKTAIHSLKTLNIFTYGPGHCLNTTPVIQLEILILWESSGRHERNLTEVQRVSKIFFKNTDFRKMLADNTLKVLENFKIRTNGLSINGFPRNLVQQI